MKQIKRVAKQRERRRFRVRNRLRWDAGQAAAENRRPRMSVFRSSKHMYVQIIDDAAGRVLVSASTVERAFRERLGINFELQDDLTEGLSYASMTAELELDTEETGAETVPWQLRELLRKLFAEVERAVEKSGK